MLQKINYQKELDKLITDLQKEEKVPTASASQLPAPHAAVMCWNT